ncbi:hypothetical protein [Desulfobacula sp.]|uniref:hypothetical protein n=1 Tax=Desulfobacula sp. TaxID=2593537 RepID=UPI00260C26CF|nr:hypothetical protein [Desulfobacula sp.]
MNNLNMLKKQILLLLIIFILTPISSSMADSKTMKIIAIIPFETNSQGDISYITSGVLKMLHSRLSWKGNVTVVKTGTIIKELSGINKSSESKTIIKLGEKTTADYVITGIVTQFSGAYSIDIKVYNLKEKSFLTFYGQSKTINKIISEIDIAAAKINKKIFDRATVSYEKFKKEKTITEEDLRRMSPERMMPVRPIGEDEGKPWWKIW